MPITGTELSTISTDVSAGSGDHGKIVLLASDGKIDSSMLPATGGGTVTSVSAGSGISVSGTTAVTVSAAYGSSSSTVCVGNDSRLSNDRTASGLRTATSVVVISSATAPTSGQVLTASSSTAASWQTPSGGGGGTTWYWYSSSEVMFDSDGVDGDFAIIVGGPTGNGNIYQKVTGHWTAVGNIKGTAGTAGTQIRSGTTAPDNSVGADGDFYMRTDTGEFFKRISGTYSLVLQMSIGVSTYGAGLSLSSGTLTVAYAPALKSATTTINVSSATAPTSGQVLTATSSTAANWQSPSSAPTGSAGGDLGGSYPNPTVTQAAGLKSSSTTVAVSSATAPSSGQVLTATSSTSATWQSPAGGTPSGSAGGDLGGTYPNPTVTQARGLVSATTTVSVSAATAPATGQVLTATDSTHATWQTPTGGAASDLATTGSNVNVSAASPPSAGKVLTATDATHATWQTPSTASFDPTTNINPAHYWRASGTSQSGGLVDSITDIGRVGGKNFTQTGTPRCPTATDGSGITYLAPDGSNDYYQAGTSADWKFLHNGSAFTIAIVYQRTAAITASEWLLDSSNGTTLNTGISVDHDFTSSTIQGPLARISRSATSNFTCLVNHYVVNTGISVLIVRHQGPGQAFTVGSSSVPVDMTMRRNGRLVSQCAGQGSYDTGNSFGALTLFAKAGATGFTSARIYELWVDDTSVSDRLIQSYEGWANSTYNSTS